MDMQTLTVLVVEDEVSIRSLMEMEFQDLGFATIAVGSVKEAEDTLRGEESEKIDLCIFDLKLPDGDGLSLLQTSKQLFPNVPVILMTGHGNKGTVLEALKRGAYDYIEKPFSISNDLFPVVRRASGAIKLQKENRSLNEQILHNSKLAALGELSATVLHDIRGPLSLIQVVCDDIEDDISEGSLNPENMTDHIKQVRKACDRIRKLGDHLRNYSRSDTHETPEEKNLDLLIEDSLFLVQQKVRKLGIKVCKEIGEDVKTTQYLCLSNKLEQVIMNLMSNACDAMKDVEDKKLILKSSREGDFINIDITDTGMGIPEDIQTKIFDNFYTTKPKGEGTGLGLKIVQNIIKEHGGSLKLQSKVGVGTTFTVVLPTHSVFLDKTENEEAA